MKPVTNREYAHYVMQKLTSTRVRRSILVVTCGGEIVLLVEHFLNKVREALGGIQWTSSCVPCSLGGFVPLLGVAAVYRSCTCFYFIKYKALRHPAGTKYPQRELKNLVEDPHGLHNMYHAVVK